ncbi:MAG: hemerythrin family protein [Victivallales bacterium]|jgi:hemerythrin
MEHEKIVWKDDLATGLVMIDKQHKQFFKLVNKLLDSSIREDESKIIFDSFVFLKYYILEHFGVEETSMVEYRYPLFAHHKNLHLYFRNEIERLELSLKANVPPHEVAIKLNYLVVNWFMNHIKVEDKKLCRYLLTEVEDDNKKLLGRLKEIVKGFFKSKG